MALALPASTSPLRDLFDVADLAAKRFVTLRQAVHTARSMFAADAAVKAVNFIVLTADGTVKLIAIGPKGGRRTLWIFGAL